jgi:integration host factor subunit beta
MSLVKKDLIRAVAKASRLRVAEAAIVVNRILDEVVHALQDGERVEIRGLGSFRSRVVTGRVARDLKRGTPLRLPPKIRVTFRAGRALKPRPVVEKVSDKTGQYGLFNEG